MPTNKAEYDKMVKRLSPKSPKLMNSVKAFLFGGAICTFGEFLNFLWEKIGLNEEYSKALTPSVLIVITAILTGVGVFDKIAKHAGAGTIVPITGFANSVVSPAVEFNAEGHILGTGANIFKIAGPVISYGILAGAVYGATYYIFNYMIK